MKKIILLLLLLWIEVTGAQPRIIGLMNFRGQKGGGSLFRADLPGATPGIVYSFDNATPHQPLGGMAAGDDNWLYGNLAINTNPGGVLYKIKKDGSNFTTLYDLPGPSFYQKPIPYYHTDGYLYFSTGPEFKKMNTLTNAVTDIPVNNPVKARNLLVDANDWIYFPTENNILAKVRTDGTQWTDIHSFDPVTEGGDGRIGLTETPGDTLFGIQSAGGLSGQGSIYSIRKDGTGFAIHHVFSTATEYAPTSRLVYFDGKLFGLTSAGGSNNAGALYTINPDGTGYRVLFNFDGNNGAGIPVGNIAITSNGRIFGTYSQSSTFNNRLFKIDTSGQNLQDIYSGSSNRVGHFTQDILLLDDENIFVPFAEYGRHNGGVLNTCDTSGNGMDIYHFGYSATGFTPVAGMIKGSNGKLYGTTQYGGTDGGGIIYSINDAGSNYTKLHEFTDTEGYAPTGKLLEASDGKLYGACSFDIATNSGCLYRLNKDGSNFQVIYRFVNAPDGYSPVGSLVEDNITGALYGITFYGGSSNAGIIFRINKDGSNYTVLKSFGSATDPAYCYAGLTQSGTYLYGSAGYGGIENKGVIFRIRKDGTGYEVLHEFAGVSSGSLPTSTPIIASNGKLYGTTAYGGATGEGTIYSMDITGANFTTLKDFTVNMVGATPWGGLIQASDGLIYGGTNFSNITPNVLSGGTLYKLNLDGSGFTVMKEFNYDTEGQGVMNLLDMSTNLVLPVKMIFFGAEKKEKTVVLSWETAQENNSERFEIERSRDGTAFVKMGIVNAAGTTSAVTNYEFTDNNPSAGINYYRLKQIDIDGRFVYSKVVTVNFTIENKLVISPNPASDRLHLRLHDTHLFQLIRILDASGKQVLQKKISRFSSSVQIDITQLPKGWYMLQLTGDTQQQQAFLKQ